MERMDLRHLLIQGFAVTILKKRLCRLYVIRKKLKPDALPAKFSWTKESKSRPAPWQRLLDDSLSKAKVFLQEGDAKTMLSGSAKGIFPLSTSPNFCNHIVTINMPFHLLLRIILFELLLQMRHWGKRYQALKSRMLSCVVLSLADLRSVVAKLKERIFSVKNILLGDDDDDAVQFLYWLYQLWCILNNIWIL